MRHRTRRAFALLVAPLLLGAVACGGDDDKSGENTAPEETEQPAVDPSATLRLGNAADSAVGFDPHKSASIGDATRLFFVYDTLIGRAEDGALEPGLAASWSWSDDGSYLELALRADVVFQDGAAFDAAAAKASLDRARTVEGSTVAPQVATVTEVEAVDDQTLRIYTSVPDPTLVDALSRNPGMMISPNAVNADDLAENPVGAGRYRLVNWTPGQGSTYESWDGYWNPDVVQASSIEMVSIPDATARLNALRTGQIDVAQIDSGQIDEAKSAGLVVDAGPGLQIEGMFFNRTKAELGDERVRQAINFAIDREGIVKGLRFDLAAPTAQFYPEGSPGYAPEADDVYTYDPDKARRLLAEAGLEDGFSFEVLVPGLPATVALAEALVPQLAEVGITMKLRQIDAAQTGTLFYGEQQGDAFVGSFPPPFEPLTTARSMVDPAAVVGNPGGHTTPEWQELLAAAGRILDDSERERVVQKLMVSMTKLGANALIDAPFQAWAMTEDVVGFARPLGGGVAVLRNTGIRAG